MGWMTGAVTRALQVVGVAGNFVQALFTQFIASGGGGETLALKGQEKGAVLKGTL